MAPVTAHAALEALWLAMVELAESNNDRAVSSHRRRPLKQAREFVHNADDLLTLARAAAILARLAKTAP